MAPSEGLAGGVAFEQALGRLTRVVTRAAEGDAKWLGRVRRSLVALLGFLDDEPGCARLLFAGERAFECERRVQSVLLGILEDRPESAVTVGEGLPSPRLIGELVLGGVFTVIRTSLLEGDEGLLVELAPSLLVFIVTPYLGQALASADLQVADVARERGRVVL
jgi:hypothetical protein